jgi:hypothetical protein
MKTGDHMSTAQRFEKAYLLNLLRQANLILRELQENTVVLPAVRGPRRSCL